MAYDRARRGSSCVPLRVCVSLDELLTVRFTTHSCAKVTDR